MEEFIKDIKETIEGYPVKNLKWNQLDNILVGMVKCPIFGRENLHGGFIICQWHKNGCPTNNYKGQEHLKLKIE